MLVLGSDLGSVLVLGSVLSVGSVLELELELVLGSGLELESEVGLGSALCVWCVPSLDNVCVRCVRTTQRRYRFTAAESFNISVRVKVRHMI